jgi:hypothetical protein
LSPTRRRWLCGAGFGDWTLSRRREHLLRSGRIQRHARHHRGFTLAELEAMPSETLDALVPDNTPIVIRVGSAEVYHPEEGS